jgi:MFS family permease
MVQSFSLFFQIDPLYIAEISPAKHRGELVTWSEIAINVGLVLGFSTGLTLSGLADEVEWRWMFGLGAILPCVMIGLVLKVMPESPRYLVAKGDDGAAKEVLQQIYPPGFDVAPIIQDIKEAVEREEASEHAVGWGVMFSPTPAIQRMLVVGVGMAIAQQAVGIDAIQYYLLDVLSQSGLENEVVQDVVLVFLGIIKLVFVYVGGQMFDTTGRRPLIFTSLAGMAAALLVISIAFFANDKISPAFTITGLAIYLSFFRLVWVLVHG